MVPSPATHRKRIITSKTPNGKAVAKIETTMKKRKIKRLNMVKTAHSRGTRSRAMATAKVIKKMSLENPKIR